MSKGATGIRRLVNALGYSLAGLRGAFQHEDSFRQELLMASILIPAAFFLGETKIEVVLLTASVLIVLIVELVNSALEATVDRISTELHALAKRAKDIGSAAVFVSLINLVTVWMLILFT